MATPRLGRTGIWSMALRYGEPSAVTDAAAELEDLGYGALWIPDVGGELFASIDTLLAATTTATVATGILNLWLHEPDDVAARCAELTGRHGPRLLVGIGVSHAPLVEGVGAGEYRKPLTRMRGYLDALDAARPPLAVEDRVLAALGPKMLDLARDRSAGAHPYLVTPDHTRIVRDALGPDRLVAPEQAVVLSTDPSRARALAREHLATYIGLPNYSNNWRRLGYTDADLADGGSDRLVDALVVWGDEATIERRVQEHRDAGADHVCVQVLTDDLMVPAMEESRVLAAALVS